jgi:hypothetical protein
MANREWHHPHGPLPPFDPQYMSGHGGHHTHYVERDGRGYRGSVAYGPACRNTVADFELGTGNVVTCKTCLRLTSVPSRIGLLVLAAT